MDICTLMGKEEIIMNRKDQNCRNATRAKSPRIQKTKAESILERVDNAFDFIEKENITYATVARKAIYKWQDKEGDC